MLLSVWLRVIRVRFLLASIIAVSSGLAFSLFSHSQFDVFSAFLTMVGVMALHASVDLLNDYWDFKRGIDTNTVRTKMSGGTGVLPEGLLKPSTVYRAGIIFLIIGSLIGSYFIFTNGILIAIILGFAILSIYFYSTKIVDSGLAEFFVGVKGTMIVLGTYYIQTNSLSFDVMFLGISIGTLSSLVLFIASFPDHDADKSKGRKTLVIAIGKKNATKIFWIFPILVYSIVLFCVGNNFFPTYSFLSFLTIPLILKAGKELKSNYADIEKLIPSMTKTLLFSRLTGLLLVISFLISFGLK